MAASREDMVSVAAEAATHWIPTCKKQQIGKIKGRTFCFAAAMRRERRVSHVTKMQKFVVPAETT
jgi:hypothetical protein